MSHSNIIGVQFEPVGKNYYFNASQYPEIKPGDPVVVSTSRGLQLATVSQVNIDTSDLDLHSFKSIERPATPIDLLNRKALLIREKETGEIIRDHLIDVGLSGIKVVSVEYSLDGIQLFILISSDSSVTYNLKHLKNDIQKLVKDVQLEIRQIGPRDAAKLIKGMGACGMETRCCSKFLTEFSSISIRMAKTQDISLTPSEITGMCGRLRCCLMYEYDQYVEAIKTLPKRKRKVITSMGEGRVVQILPLQQAVIVNLPEIGPRKFLKEELDRAEKIANGEIVEPEVIEDTQPKRMISRPEDQQVSRKKKSSNRNRSTKSSSRRRSRNSRRSNKHRN
ncbi:MAG: regulatory iron-sulfur-containing complex subunit RicT [Chloroflexota bacterium]|nr:regulatory iron-sulfur-containing complex subunit RicT [Chloroflexota bacterium]